MIVDDYPCVREGLSSLLGRCPGMVVVGQAASCAEGATQLQALRPDVTILDIKMPDAAGPEAIRAVRGDCREARILVFTTLNGDEDIYRALQFGAKGYLLKDASPEKIVEAIRSVHAGKTVIPPNVATKLAERLRLAKLTAREQDVLRVLADGSTNQEIAARLFISEGTVKSHINNILAKMNVKDRTQALIVGLKRGLLHWP